MGLEEIYTYSVGQNRRKIDDSVPDMKERVQIIDSGKLGLDFNGNSGSLTIVDGTEMEAC